MLKHYLTIAVRTIRRNPMYALINTLGLSVGMACCVLILLYVQNELSYDTHHKQADRVVRITRAHGGGSGRTMHFAFVGPPFAAALVTDYPEIEAAVRFTHGSGTVRTDERLFHEERFYFADAGVFEVFTLPMISGDPNTALKESFTVVLTASTAKKYFGSDDPLGQTLTYQDEHQLTVTGIIEDVPENSHLHFDILASYATQEALWGPRAHTDDAWQWHNAATYLLLRDSGQIDRLQEQLPAFLFRHTSDNRIKFQTLHLQPLTDIHLYSHLDKELETNGDIQSVRLFSIIAFLIVLIACINFMNLSTARAAHRVIEVGIRKTLGGQPAQIMRQFLGESLLQACLAFVVATLLVQLILPTYNDLTGKHLHISYMDGISTWAWFAGLTLAVGVIAGVYPAFYFMRIRPISLLSRSPHASVSLSGIRKALVVFQFAIAVMLIIGTVAVRQQLSYINEHSFKIDQVLIVVLPVDDAVRAKNDILKQTLRQHPDILSVGGSWDTPAHTFNTVMGPVRAEVNGELVTPQPGPKFFIIDHDFIPTYDLTIIAGRNFSENFSTDDTEGFIINESTVKAAGWSSPREAIGQAFQYANRKGHIIGVVEDFYLESFHHPIAPIVMYIRPPWIGSLSVRLKPDHASDVIGFLEETWQRVIPTRPFRYEFLDDQVQQQYLIEIRLEQILGVFTALGAGIACLGLFGLAFFTAEQRTREIGIRKVLGASVLSIVKLLLKDFTILVLIAVGVAAPVAYVTMSRWLQGFIYRIDLGVDLFLWTGLLVVSIAWATVSYQSVRAALTNPVDALRHE